MILRTSWVMGSVGKNFELTMLRMLIGVVADQVGDCSDGHLCQVAYGAALE